MFVRNQQPNRARDIFTEVIKLDENWAEAWNKRATVLYMLGEYQKSQEDIDKVLELEPRHFGALAGQGLVNIELKNYENSKTFETVKNPSNVITRIDAALLIRDKKVIDPETEEITYEPVSPEVIEELRNLVKSALGIKPERGDTLTITSQPFVEEFDGFQEKWYETPWFRATIENSLLVLLIGIVALGVVRPMLNKILVPTASTNSVMELYAEAETMAEMAAKRATETAAVEVDEGESLDEIKAKLKPKKRAGISADLLDTANTYDDKVALVRMIVTDEAGRVANVFKQMMRDDLELLK